MTDENPAGRQLGPATTCHVDRDGVIVKTNSRFNQKRPQDFLGLKLENFLEEPSRTEYLHLLQQAIEHGAVNSYENVVRDDSGTTRWQIRISPWRDDGRIIGAIMVGNQILD